MNPMKQGLRLAGETPALHPNPRHPAPRWSPLDCTDWIVRTNGVIAIQVLPDNLMVNLRPGRLP